MARARNAEYDEASPALVTECRTGVAYCHCDILRFRLRITNHKTTMCAMIATRSLLSPIGPGLGGIQSKLIVPPSTFFDVASSALSGAWAVLSDQSSRDRYEAAIHDHIIKDEVLSQASNGSVLTYALFHNIYQDELFADCKFDAKEFARVVGPALENFHDTLERLQTTFAATSDAGIHQEKMTGAEKKSDDQTLAKLRDAFMDVNEWRTVADNDPESLAAHFSKMATPTCFDMYYFTTKLTASLTAPCRSFVKCSVYNAALLRARAQVIPNENYEDVVGEYDEFDLSKTIKVAAQLDVLYEYTLTHEVSTNGVADVVKETATPETISTTKLGVAIIEGWLSGGPEKHLRWKVAFLREAHEFPDYVSTIERQ
ncbi:hypothetical protein MPSEU_000378100 [Mayamaea pseudoterrestris]|nr:hypothetical protein MPSEU_000378100 [Mayamaea pseudoterrestris]